MNLKFFFLALFSWFGLELLVVQILSILFKNNDLWLIPLENNPFILFLSRSIVATALLFLFFFMFRKFYPKEYLKVFIFRWISGVHLLFFITLYLFLLGLLSILHTNGYLSNPPFMLALQNNPPPLLLSVYSVVLVGVLIEEFFFRGWLFYILQKNHLKPHHIVFISSFVFCQH